MAFQGNFTAKFSTRVLQRVLRETDMSIKELAFHLGVPYKTCYNWVMGIVSYPPDLISKLYHITKKALIFHFFLHPCNFIALEDPHGKGRKLIEQTLKDIKELWEFLDFEKDEVNKHK